MTTLSHKEAKWVAVGIKELVRAKNPFALGINPDRVAPMHVLNGFLAAVIGNSELSTPMRQLLISNEEIKDPSKFPALERSPWQDSPQRLSQLRDDLKAAFDADRRTWYSDASPFPVGYALVQRDRSDEGYGAALWRMLVAASLHIDTATVFRMVEPCAPADALTALYQALVPPVDGLSDPPEPPSGSPAWFDQSDGWGPKLRDNLSKFVASQLEPVDSATRLQQLRHLARAAFLASWIGAIYGQIAAAGMESAKVPPIVAYADTPPGQNREPFIEASALVFGRLTSLVKISTAQLAARRITEGYNARQPNPWKGAVKRQLDSTMRADHVSEVLAVLDTSLGGFDDSTGTKAYWTRALERSIGPDTFGQGLRSMGRKVGLVGPDRGYGSPRFVLETPLLATLVAGLVDESTDLAGFVDALYDRLNIAVGIGHHVLDDGRVCDAMGGPDRARPLLEENQRLLGIRLVRAGLAKEYSDLHTEVIAS